MPALKYLMQLEMGQLIVEFQPHIIGYPSIKPYLFLYCAGGMTAIEKITWIHYGGGQDLWDKLYSQFEVKSILSVILEYRWEVGLEMKLNQQMTLKE